MNIELIWQYLLLFLTMVVQVIIPPIPAELIVVAAGLKYGAAATTLVAGSGLLAGSVLVFYFGRYLESRFAPFFQREKVAKAVRRIREYETVILWVRILPYNPADVISYAAGIVRITPSKFILITTCASFVRTWFLATLGSRIVDLKMAFVGASILIFSWIVGSLIVFGRRRP